MNSSSIGSSQPTSFASSLEMSPASSTLDLEAPILDDKGERRRVSFTSGPSEKRAASREDSGAAPRTEHDSSRYERTRTHPSSGYNRSRVGSASQSLPKLLVYCAGPCLERARPLLRKLEDCGVKVSVRTDTDLANADQETECDALLVLWSQFFQGPHEGRLIEISDRVGRAGALVLNDVRKLVAMQDRRWLLQKLKEHGLPTPMFVSRDLGTHDASFEEHDDYIMIGGNRINKPFVEKPVDRRDREIYVYFPNDAGGGRALLSTRESGEVEYVCRFEPCGRVRKEGSFVYQEYLQSDGFVVQAVCAGGLSYGHALLSGVVSQPGVASQTASQPCAVWLRQEEKIIASKLNVLLQQTLIGLTFVRSQTAGGSTTTKSNTSYIIDAWPGIPRRGFGAHLDDIVRALLSAMSSRLPIPGMHMRSRSLPRFPSPVREAGRRLPSVRDQEAADAENKALPEGPGSPSAQSGRSSETSYRSSGVDFFGDLEEAELLCVLMVARHSERTPKQKVKAKVTLASEFAAGWLCGWLAGDAVRAPLAAAPPNTLELRKPEQMQRLSQAAKELQADGHDVGTLADALTCIRSEGMACHAKVGSDGKRIVVGLKWGGELTSTGVEDAEELGKAFRKETYPKEDIDELHATLRHDIKIYASREPRCQQTAAAFSKGLLRLDHALPPIIAALVRTDEFGRLEGGSKNYVSKQSPTQSGGDSNGGIVNSYDLPAPDTPWAELESIIGAPCVASILRNYSCPGAAVQELRTMLEQFSAVLAKGDMLEALAGAETPLLLRGRYEDAIGDLGTHQTPRLDKVSHMLDNLEYDQRHNSKALPKGAVAVLAKALPLCEVLCDVITPLETALERRACGPAGSSGPGVALLSKLRWDLRVASGADLGDERDHLVVHEALYAAVAPVGAGELEKEAVPVRVRLPAQCVRTRLYFSHNSQLTGLLNLLLASKSAKSERGSGGERDGCSDSDRSNPSEVKDLLTQRLGFLAHFVVRLWRRRDGVLRVTCDFSPNGSDQRVQLFDMPLAEVDFRWSSVLDLPGGPPVASECGSSTNPS